MVLNKQVENNRIALANQHFVDFCIRKLASIQSRISKDPAYLTSEQGVRDTHEVMTSLYDQSFLYGWEQLLAITSFLRKKFTVQDLLFQLSQDESRIIKEGIVVMTRHLLQLSQEEASDNEQFYSNDSSIHTKKIAIYDQDTFLVDWLGGHLIGTDFELVRITPETMVTTLANEDIVTVVVDIHPGDQTGAEIIGSIRRNPYLSDMPIVAVTHSKSEQTMVDLLESGVDHVLHKPFSIPIFSAILSNLSQRQKRNRYRNEYLNSYMSQREEMITLLQKEWLRFQRFQSNFSVLQVKLDLYHSVIGEHGMEAVVEYLSKVYSTCSKTIRTYDEIKKWGRDSFLILFPATRLDGAVMAAERIKECLAENRYLTDLSDHLMIGAIESELSYQSVDEMVLRLEKELSSAMSRSSICRVSPTLKVATRESRERRRVLVIDNDPVSASIIKNHLDDVLWDVEICLDGTYAMERALLSLPDIIISETRLAELDGYLFCSQIRNTPQLEDTIFLFLTNQKISKHIVRGLQIGADDYILKPFSAKELESRMQNLVKNKERNHKG